MSQQSLMVWPVDTSDLMSAVATLVSEYGYAAVAAEIHLHGPAIPSAPARPTDPETSHLASKREADVGRFSMRSRQARLLRLFASHMPMTDQRAAILVCGYNAQISALEGCRRRMSDLRAAGYLADSGKRTQNAGSNDDAIMWKLTHEGVAALNHLETTGWSK